MLSVKELKKELKKRELRTSGNKKQLFERLTGSNWTFSNTPSGNFLTGNNTPSENIWVAAVQGNTSMVKRHIREGQMKPGYNIDQLSPFGRTALEQASLGGNINTIKLLIQGGSFDLNGTAYLSSNHVCRRMMGNMGFKGHSFLSLPQVKLLQAKRNLEISKIDMDYDVLTLIIAYTRKCFTNEPTHHAVLKRSLTGL